MARRSRDIDGTVRFKYEPGNAADEARADLDAISRAIGRQERAAERTSASLVREFEKIERAADPVARATARTEAQIEKLNRAVREHPELADRAARAQANLERKLERTKDRIEGNRRETAKLSVDYRNLARAAGGVAAAVGLVQAASAAARGVQVVTRDTLVRTAGFEEALSSVAAMSGATRGELDLLRGQARALGAETAFSARQAAEGMTFLAMAGFEVGEVAEAMPGQLALAAAGQLDLARAADISSNILSAFNREAGDAGLVADVLAKAASSSNTSVEQLGDAFKFVGTSARATNTSIETTAAAISVLSNAGQQADMAGTGLRRVLNDLAAPSDLLRQKMGSAAFEGGNLVEVLREIRANGSLDLAEANQIFGDRGQNAILALLSALDDLERFEGENLEALGTAAEIAGTRLDNLKGDVIALGSAYENLTLEAGDGAAGAKAREFVQLLTEGLRDDDALALANVFENALASSIDTATAAMRGLVEAGYGLRGIGNDLEELATGRLRGLSAVTGALGRGLDAVTISPGEQLAWLRSGGRDERAASVRARQVDPDGGEAVLDLAREEQRLLDEVARRRGRLARAQDDGILPGLAEDALERSRAKLAAVREELGRLADDVRSQQRAVAAAQRETEASALVFSPAIVAARPQSLGEAAFGKEGERLAQLTEKANEAGQAAAALAQAREAASAGVNADIASLTAEAAALTAAARAVAAGDEAGAKAAQRKFEIQEATKALLADTTALSETEATALARAAVAAREKRDFAAEELTLREKLDQAQKATARAASDTDFLKEGRDLGEEELLIRERMLAMYERIGALTAEQRQDVEGTVRALAEQQLATEAVASTIANSPSADGGSSDKARLTGQAATSASDNLAGSFSTEMKGAIRDVFATFSDEGESASELIASRFRRAMTGAAQSAMDRALGDVIGAMTGGSNQSANGGLGNVLSGFGNLFSGRGGSGPITARSGIGLWNDDPEQRLANAQAARAQQTAQAQAAVNTVGQSVGAGFLGYGIGSGIGDMIRPEANATNQRVGGALGGAAGFLLGGGAAGVSALLAGGGLAAAGAAMGSVVPIIGTAVGALVGAIAGSLIGKESNKFATGTLDLSSGRRSDLRQKDNSEATIENVKARDAMLDALLETTSAFTPLLGDDARATARIGVDFGGRDGFVVEDERRAGSRRVLDAGDGEGAFDYAFGLFLDSVQGGDRALVEFARAANRAGIGAEQLAEDLEAVKTAREFNDAPETESARRLAEISTVFDRADAAIERAGLDRASAPSQAPALPRPPSQPGAPRFEIPDEWRERLNITLSDLGLDRSFAPLQVSASALSQSAASLASAANDNASAVGDLLNLEAERAEALRRVAADFDERTELRRLDAESPAEAQARRILDTQIEALREAREVSEAAGGAEARLSAVRAANTAELTAFIESQGATAEALSAVEAAIASMADEARAAGLSVADLAADLTAARAAVDEAVKAAASSFDDAQVMRRLDASSPAEAQARRLLEAQIEAMREAREISEAAGGAEQRLALVRAANAAELQALIENQGASADAFTAIAAAIAATAKEAMAAGTSFADLTADLSAVRASAAGAFDNQVGDELRQRQNPALAAFQDLLDGQVERMRAARTLGADEDALGRLQAFERRDFFDGLSEEDRESLGEFFGTIRDLAGPTAAVLTQLVGTVKTSEDQIRTIAEEARARAQDWDRAIDSVATARAQIERDFLPGTRGERIDVQVAEFRGLAARAQNTSLDDDDRADAAARLGALGQDILRLEREASGSSTAFRETFELVTGTLESVEASGVRARDLQERIADRAADAVKEVQAVRELIADQEVTLPELERQSEQLDDIRDVLGDNGRLAADLLAEYTALRREQDQQRALTFEELERLAQPTQATGGAPAASGADQSALIQAIKDQSSDEIQAAESLIERVQRTSDAQVGKIKRLEDQQVETNRLLRLLLSRQSDPSGVNNILLGQQATG